MAVKRQSMADRVRGNRQADPQRGGGGGLVFSFGDYKGSTDFFEPKVGVNEFDILPFTVTRNDTLDKASIKPGDLWWRMPFRIHRNIGPEDKAVLCPSTFGKRCPICEEQAAMAKQYGYKDDRAKGLRHSERTFYAVRDLNNPDKGVQLWPVSYHNFTKVLLEELDAFNGEMDHWADPDGGCSVRVRFTQETMGTNKFLDASRIDFLERPDLEDEILEATPSLDAFLNCMEYGVLERLFLDLPEDGEDQTPAPAQRSAAPVARPAARAAAPVARPAASRPRAPEPAEDPVEEEYQEPVDDTPAEETPPARAAARPASARPAPARATAPARPAPARPAAPAAPAQRAAAPARPAPAAKPAPARAAKAAPAAPAGDCPAEADGGIYGQTCDGLDMCESCELWTECRDATDAYNKG